MGAGTITSGGASFRCAAISCHFVPGVNNLVDFYATHLKRQYHYDKTSCREIFLA